MADPVSTPGNSASYLPDLGQVAQNLAQKSQDPLSTIGALGQQQKSGQFSKEDSRYVYIRGYGMTSAQDDKPVLGTNGAGPCLILALHNPAEKTAMLAHFDANTDINSLRAVIEKMGGKNQPLQAHLAGGHEVTRGMVNGVVDILKEYDQVSIKSADIMTPMGTTKALAIDSRSGEIYTNFMSVHMDKGPDHRAVMTHHASTAMSVLPLRPDYVDGTSFIVPSRQPAPSTEIRMP